MLQRGDIRDPLIENTVISISEVRMSPDLKIATAYIAPLGDIDHAAVVAALNRSRGYIRKRVTPALRQLKYMPDLRFRDDTSFENYRRIDALLRSPAVLRDLDGDSTNTDED